MNKLVKEAAILTIITLVAGGCLALVYEITKAPIAASQEKAKQEAYSEVFPGAEAFEEKKIDEKAAEELLEEYGYENNTIEEVVAAADSNGELLGDVITVTSHQGYGGDITFSMGIQNDGTLNGIAILSISETAGLGMKAAEESFRDQFSGKLVGEFKYVKGTGTEDYEIDALSGATITTNAVTDGVNAGLCFVQNISGGGKADE